MVELRMLAYKVTMTFSSTFSQLPYNVQVAFIRCTAPDWRTLHVDLRGLQYAELILRLPTPRAEAFELVSVATLSTPRMGIVKGAARAFLLFVWPDFVVQSLECGAHNDECGHPDTDVHLHYCKRVGRNMCILRLGFGQGVGIEHDDETCDGEAGVNETEEDQAEKLLYFGAVFLEFDERGDRYNDDHSGGDEIEGCRTAEHH
jgi:hypothetical protein